MNKKQVQVLNKFLADWNEKASIGCLVVGLFQRDHIIGGIIGAIACFIIALTIKMRSVQDDV